MKLKKKLRIVFLGIILAGFPFLLTDWSGSILPFNNASADIGTCCPEDESICIVGEHVIGNYFSQYPGEPCPGDIWPAED